MLNRLLFSALLLCFLSPLAAQDPVLSQFYAAPLRLNPAFAGVSTAPRIALNYRSQHTAYPSAFTTIAASYEQPIEKTPSSFGLRMMSDRQLEGAYKNTELALVYSYDVQVNEYINARLGLSAGILSTSLDFNTLTFGDVLDPTIGADGVTMEALAAQSKTSADFGAGIVLYGKNYFGGISFDHLNRPDESLIELNSNLYAGRPQRFTITGGYITPNFLFTSQGRFKQLNTGAYFGYGPVAVGGWYRYAFENGDALIASIRFRQDVLQIGLSYDAVTSALRTVPGGLGATYEVSVTIDLSQSKELQRRRKANRYNDCFGMFR